MFYLMAKMMEQALFSSFKPRPRIVSNTVVVYNTQPKPGKKVVEKSVEQLKEERKYAQDVQARKLTDALNTDYLD